MYLQYLYFLLNLKYRCNVKVGRKDEKCPK